jgi:hypothetical protein
LYKRVSEEQANLFAGRIAEADCKRCATGARRQVVAILWRYGSKAQLMTFNDTIKIRNKISWLNGAPERIRTSDPQIRSLVLYPAELRARYALREKCGGPRAGARGE